MKYMVNVTSGIPIYKQLMEQIRQGILGNLLEPGQQMPTVRELALELTVNPNTVARAYRELEALGLLESVQGRGTFVAAQGMRDSGQERMAVFRQSMEELLDQAVRLNISPEELQNMFCDVLEERKKNNGR